MEEKISLYECENAHVSGQKIYCTKGHELRNASYMKLSYGHPLVCSGCQSCVDFSRNGPAVAREDMGWKQKRINLFNN